MSADLNDFFAKKASKTKKKTKCLNVNSLGQKLDKSVQLEVCLRLFVYTVVLLSFL